jgi:hypothetical protein
VLEGEDMAHADTTVRIEAHNRWDALDLTNHLPTWKWYLVNRDSDQWDIVVGCEKRKLEDQLMDTVREWATRREIDSVVHLRDADVVVHPKRPGA